MGEVKHLTKQPNESKLYSFSFDGQLRTADTIASVTSIAASPTGELTIGAASHDSDKIAQARISGGVDETTYRLTCIVVTTLGDTLEIDGDLYVYDF